MGRSHGPSGFWLVAVASGYSARRYLLLPDLPHSDLWLGSCPSRNAGYSSPLQPRGWCGDSLGAGVCYTESKELSFARSVSVAHRPVIRYSLSCCPGG